MRRTGDSPIVVVSGLPRSGTSMTMRMLAAGGVPILTDRLRLPDPDNPHGYFEFEPVKHLHTGADTAWLSSARGKAVKIISFLLTWLPETYSYRVLFMRRDLHEVLASQNTMIGRHPGGTSDGGGPTAEETLRIYEEHLTQVSRFLAKRACFTTLGVEYASVVAHPHEAAARMAEFLGGALEVSAMAAAVDPALHRQRR